MRLKRWESPRREGRNDKGKGGAARARQLRKQQQQLRRKLKDNSENRQGRDSTSSLIFLGELSSDMLESQLSGSKETHDSDSGNRYWR